MIVFFEQSMNSNALLYSPVVTNHLRKFSRIRNQSSTSGFSSPSSLHAERKKSNNNTSRNDSPGSELFPTAGSSYVPSGLTEKEWNEIKRKERQELEKKEFGAWGPRFARSERPDGDWMITPNLWTRGFNANNNGANLRQGSVNWKLKESGGVKERYSISSSSTKGWKSNMLRRQLSIYALAYFIVECLCATFYSFHRKAHAALILMAAMKLRKSRDAVMMITAPSMLFQMVGVKLVVSAMLFKPLQSLMMKIQGRFQRIK